MTPVLICEAPHKIEYFVFDFCLDDCLQCLGNYSASWWQYLLIGVSSLGEKAFHCFHDEEKLIQYLTTKRILPDSIKVLKERNALKDALMKALGDLPPMYWHDAAHMSTI